MSLRLKSWANILRQDIIMMLAEAGSGHPGGALGMAELFSLLFFKHLKHRPLDPTWAERDIFVLSAGHICPIYYAALAETGYFARSELLTLRKFRSLLQGHPHNLDLSGIETSSGPLGQGLSQAIGFALTLQNTPRKVYTVLSDGEHDEGQTWEAIALAGARQIDNLIVIVDRNRIQLSGGTENILSLGDLAQKYRSFNWTVLEVDANNLDQLDLVLQKARETKGPICLMANSVLGKGVSFMENNYKWHGKAPSLEEAEQALKELEDDFSW